MVTFTIMKVKFKELSKTPPIIGIYKFDYPDGKCYIGQAINIVSRIQEHNDRISAIMQGKTNRPFQLCDKKMAEYGQKINEFEILEITNDIEKLDEIEQIWVKKFHCNEEAFGYNVLAGGNASGKRGVENANAAFNQEQLDDIIDLLINHTELSIVDIANKYNVDQSTIINISKGKSYVNPQLNYPLRLNNHASQLKNEINDYFKDINDLLALKEDLKYRWDLQIEPDLVQKYNIPIRILRAINTGKKFENIGNYEYPIRPKNIRNTNNFTQQDIINILNDLRTSNESMTNIGLKYHINRSTVSKINIGSSYIIKDYNYPARLKAL